MSTIVVTGASAGIGLSISKYLLADARKHRLVLCCNSNDKALRELANDPANADRVFVIKGDTADAKFVSTVFAQSLVHFEIDRIDALVLNHGTLGDGTRIADCTQKTWEWVFRVNFFSIVDIIQHTIPYLRESQGRIIITSSGAAEGSTTTWGPYGASKAAINHLARTLAKEEPVITTVSIRPGMVETGMQTLIRGDASKHMDTTDRQRFVGAYEQGKLLPADKPGHVTARLATEAKKELSGLFLTWNDTKLADYQDA
ncbi:uncharacterized protein HMPREF1541_00963 [Cyphellophora europaea CBS 101466]|uniref:Short-chain dehydrogenase n=1 Tax=Cyphellophora europaea (strain CBS 101466) TaxID=1220924 RepID=W2SFU8_CYPE1|nr:uncharacterized protein HMPREF1541_00963 [Cyphellophora europaea CBS 101466]ETN46774.1 hypothetical protein HMPREF1541_00963 [Cyphellophora europaea CBS 101466]